MGRNAKEFIFDRLFANSPPFCGYLFTTDYSDFQLSATKNRTASESERGRLVRIERLLARDNPLTKRDAGG